mgnify:CR=1 FL=1
MRGTRARWIAVVTALLCAGGAQAGNSPTLAVVGIETENVARLQATIAANFLRGYFVNSNVYTVVDRDHMEKVLRQQSLQGYGVISDAQAVRVGELLDVKKIVVGAIMRLAGEYYLEMRIIDVETSSIEKCKTERCTTVEQFPAMTRRLVERLTGTTIPVEESPADSDSTRRGAPVAYERDYYKLDKIEPVTGSEAAARRAQARRFRMIGFSADDYRRYTTSGLGQQEWARQDHRSGLVAGLLGACPLASGFFYTRNYGPAVFLTITKTGGLIGTIPANWKGGHDTSIGWVFPAALAAATLTDIIGSAYSAHSYNEKLTRQIGRASCRERVCHRV